MADPVALAWIDESLNNSDPIIQSWGRDPDQDLLALTSEIPGR